MKNSQTLVLEESTNTHEIRSNEEIKHKKFTNGDIALQITNGTGTVHHGEHGTLKTESVNVLKTVQQELNPITRMLQNAFD